MAKDDLRPVRSKDEAKKRGRNGGIKSGEARRRKKTLRQLLEIALSMKHGDMTTDEALTLALIEKGLSGDVRAYEVIRDTLGEKPIDKNETAVSAQMAITWQKTQ